MNEVQGFEIRHSETPFLLRSFLEEKSDQNEGIRCPEFLFSDLFYI